MHSPPLSFVSRYPVASESPHAPRLAVINLTSHVHVPQELSRASTAFSTVTEPGLLYSTYVYRFVIHPTQVRKKAQTMSPVFFVRVEPQALLIQPNARVACFSFVRHTSLPARLTRGDECTLKTRLVSAFQRFRRLWHRNEHRSGTNLTTVSRPSLQLRAIGSHTTKYAFKVFNESSPINEVFSKALKRTTQFHYYKRYITTGNHWTSVY